MGVFSQLEKARLVKKLKAARDRRRREKGKCEGRLTRLERAERSGETDEVQRLAAATALAKRLHRASPKTGERLSLRRISKRLADEGYLNERGEPYHPQSIDNMLNG
jgi:hypothetical protein